MGVEQMRAKIATVYDGMKWKDRVHRMSKNQVIAVYYNFLNTGKFDKKKKQEKENGKYEQMTIYDYI